jgi:hypothetical protein
MTNSFFCVAPMLHTLDYIVISNLIEVRNYVLLVQDNKIFNCKYWKLVQ